MVSVLYTVARIRAGGSVTLVRTRVRLLPDHGVDPHVCAISATADDAVGREVIEEWRNAGVPTKVIAHGGRQDIPRTLRTLTALAREVDIVHNANAPEVYAAAAARLARRPLIRDLISTAPQGRLGRVIARTAAVNLAVSHAVADVHQAPRTEVLYPPIAIDAPLADPADVPRGGPTVLVVARFAPGKGLHLLPGIAVAARRRLPGVRFLVAGDGFGRAELEAQLRAAGVADVVTMLGFRSDIHALHAATDIYLSTSQAEGLVGYATLESALSGTPIVASNIPAVTEVLRDGIDALIVDPVDSGSVADALANIANDNELAENLAQNASARVRSLINPVSSVSRLTQLYNRLAA